MVRVEPFGYPLENRLIPKIDLMCERCSSKTAKRDAVLLFEGAEGEGKTTFSIAVAFYVAKKLGREFTHKNVFFDAEKMIKFLQSTDEQIAIYDEPALQALSTDFASKTLKNLTRLLMMVRKKRHFIMINMTHFNKFNDYIVCTRPLGMIHVYSRRGVESGRFLYIRKKFLENLWLDWKFKKKRNYVKYAMMSGKIMGSFPDVLSDKYKHNVLSEFDNASYEKQKDDAIMQVGKTSTGKATKKEVDFIIFKKLIGNHDFRRNPIKTQAQMAKILGITDTAIRKWRYLEPPPIIEPNCGTINNSNGKAVCDDDAVVNNSQENNSEDEEWS